MLKASDVMIRDVYLISSTSSVKDALKLFAEKGISGSPIVNDHREVVGYISDGDIMRQLGRYTDPTGGYIGWATIGQFYWAAPLPPDQLGQNFDQLQENVELLLQRNVLEICSKKVVSVSREDSLVDVANILSHKKIKKVPVVEGKEVLGIVSRGDIVRSIVKRFVETHEQK